MKELNPLTGEESVSSSTGSRQLKVFSHFLQFFLFTGEKGKMKPDSGLSRVSIKSNVITLLAGTLTGYIRLRVRLRGSLSTGSSFSFG